MKANPFKKCSWCLRFTMQFLCFLIMTVPSGNTQTLRVLADRHGIFYGAAVGAAFWGADTLYKETLKRECNIIVAENVMKFGLIEPKQNQFNWTRADDLVNFAQQNKMKVRGHNLIWHQQSDWASKVNGSRDEMIAIMRNHILAVAGCYKGKIYEWDVVNEAIDNGDGFLRDTFWKQKIGDDYIDLAFRFALDEQGKEYQALMTVFLNNPNCKSFLTWGITDKYSWIPSFFKGYGIGLPIDENYKPKPAYAGMKTALQVKTPARK